MQEVWKKIEGFHYSVSDHGRVKNDKTGKILKPAVNNKGYLWVRLCFKGGVKDFLVHRLVATAYIPNPNSLPFINHRDCNPLNNCIDNLEWCTPKYNVNYSDCIKKRVEKLAKPVSQYTIEGVFIAIYPSAKEAARQTGISQGSISGCCLGNRKTAGGYIWQYA